MKTMSNSRSVSALVRAGTFLGIGMGGFVDGILFHQLLQFHSMVTGRLPKTSIANLEINMFWDGMFHALTWTMTAIGLLLFWKAVKRVDTLLSGKAMVGGILLGWGLFNFFEGLIDHHLLHLHHVVERLGVSVYDYLFLASGLIFGLIGVLAVRSAASAPVKIENR